MLYRVATLRTLVFGMSPLPTYWLWGSNDCSQESSCLELCFTCLSVCLSVYSVTVLISFVFSLYRVLHVFDSNFAFQNTWHAWNQGPFSLLPHFRTNGIKE